MRTVIVKLIPVCVASKPFNPLLLKVLRHYLADCLPRWFTKLAAGTVSWFFCVDWPWEQSTPSFTFPLTNLGESGLRAEGADITIYLFTGEFQLPVGWSGYALDRVGFVKVFPASSGGEMELLENLRVLHLEDNEANRKRLLYRKLHAISHEFVHLVHERSEAVVPIGNVDLVRVSDLAVIPPAQSLNEWVFSVQRFPYSEQDPFPRRFLACQEVTS